MRVPALVLAGVVAAVSTARAATWCSVNHPTAVFCDDFDRYCVDPPPAPEACASGSGRDFNALRRVWEWTNVVCSDMTLEDGSYESPPFSARTPNQAGALITHHGVKLGPYCQRAFGPEYLSVMGTDAKPLILEFTLDGQTGGRIHHALTFMELGFGNASAATDYVLSPNCSACGGDNIQYPIICRVDGAPANCPPLSTAPLASSLAVGSVAYLDTDPCECGGSTHSPQNTHLSFFDGFKWHILRAGLFPGGGSGGSAPGDFVLRNGFCRIRLTIRTATVRVELTSLQPDPDEYSWCDIPRAYLGEFNRLYAGFRVPCRLKPGEWACQTNYACVKGVPNGGVPKYDNVVLYGGQGFVSPGACCDPATATCRMAFGSGDCLPDGGIYHGSGVTCEEVACCPAFLPDHDLDGDVDLIDFSYLQLCLSDKPTDPPAFPCVCADLNGDEKVNQNDIPVFINCISGSELPADPGCLD